MKTKKTRYFKKKKTIRNKKSLLKKKTIRNKSLLLKMIKKRKSLTRKYRKVSGGNDNVNENEKVKEMEENQTNWYEDYNTTKNKLDMLNNLYNNNLKVHRYDHRYHDEDEAEIELAESEKNLLDFKETEEYKTYLTKNDILKTYLTKNRFQRWLANKKLPDNEKIIKENVDNLRNDEIEKEKKMKIQANVEIQRARQKIIEEEEE